MTTIDAIDRLNSWVRSESHSGWWNSPRNAIYDWKNHVLQREILRGAECSAIHLSLKCRRCDGTGKYTDWSGYTYPTCRKCDSTGQVRLWFVVTRIGDYVWHTPRDRAWRFLLPEEFWKSARLSTDWEPNAKGRDLALWEVTQCLNVCEEAVQRGELCKPGSHHEGWDCEFEIRHVNYGLTVRDLPTVCPLCGHVGVPKKEHGWLDGHHHHVVLGSLSWSQWACDECIKAHGPTGTRIFDALKMHPPMEKLAHPEIQKWMARHTQEARSR